MDIITRQHLLLNPLVMFKKTHPDAQLPKANNSEIGTGDSGYDLTAVEDVDVYGGNSAVVPVGLMLAYIQDGYWFRIEPRSGLGFKHNIQPHLGVIDNGCLLYTSPSPRDGLLSRMPSSA